MLTPLAGLLIFLLPLILVLLHQTAFITFVLITNGIPLGIFGSAKEYLGGMGLSALKLFSTLASFYMLVLFNPSQMIRNAIRYPFYCLFLFFCFLAIFWAPSFEYSFRMLLKLLSPFVFLLVAPLFVNQKRNIEHAIFIGLLILLMFSLVNHFISFPGDRMSNRWREMHMLTAPFMSPATFSFSMACGAMLSLANYLIGLKKKYLILFFVFSIAVLFALTRISIAGLLVSVSILIFFLARSVLLKLLLPISLFLGITVAFVSCDRLIQRSFQHSSSVSMTKLMENPGSIAKNIHTSGRAELWADARNRFFYPSPLIGSGLGATQEFYYGKGKEGSGVVHSEYLRILCEVGIVGLILFFLAIVQIIIMLMITYRSSSTGVSEAAIFKKKYSILAISALLFYLITMATDNTIDYAMNLGFYVFFFVGFALSKNNTLVPKAVVV